MVYSIDIFNTSSPLSIQNFTAQAPAPSAGDPTSCPLTNSNNRSDQPKVAVYWNGCGIHTITGPTPLIEISKNVTRLENGMPTVVTTKINLIGKIFVNSPADGPNPKTGNIQNLMASVVSLEKLFNVDKSSKSIGCGNLRVVCCTSNGGGGGFALTDLYAMSGVRVVDVSFTRTDNNWTNFIDYNVTLEHLGSMNDWYIKEYNDSWNIESLEEYAHTDFNVTGPQKSEWHNPNLKPVAPTTSNQQPSPTPVGGRNAQADATLRVLNYPRFKVSHTVSAVGLPKPSGDAPGYCTATGLPTPNAYADIEVGPYSAFHQAKKFVEDRASIVLGPGTNGAAVWTSLSGGLLYNHVRSVRADVGGASYEVTDTFLGMPTGVAFLEDYDVEVTTDQTYIHTVRVKGEIKGLSIADPALFDKPIMITGGAPKAPVGSPPQPQGLSGSSLLIDPKAINDKALTATLGQNTPNTTTLSANAYNNATSGWISNVKPYLYRRACLFMHSSDRATTYYPPLSQSATNPPNNPIYSKHNVLNIIPISTSEGHNPQAGTISYSYEFNNKFTIISGVVYENISVEDNGPTDIVAEAFVLGRALGPILQNMGTTTSAKKSVTIEIGVIPPTTMNGYFINSNECPVWTGGSVYTTINKIIEGLKPFGDRDISIFGNPSPAGGRPATNMPGLVFKNKDDYTWDASTGKFVRSVGWTYQQCNNSRTWFDN